VDPNSKVQVKVKKMDYKLEEERECQKKKPFFSLLGKPNHPAFIQGFWD
jgi:hypothetical protein